ncbi:hypothetical protein BC830DRAFT_1111818 [Chytriomyces sp. MP71]|nr:hypothetical protein BC830DRAFT_1111818 [Chytriomyces sp. MP71]
MCLSVRFKTNSESVIDMRTLIAVIISLCITSINAAPVPSNAIATTWIPSTSTSTCTESPSLVIIYEPPSTSTTLTTSTCSILTVIVEEPATSIATSTTCSSTTSTSSCSVSQKTVFIFDS